jgi:hypothetical protein
MVGLRHNPSHSGTLSLASLKSKPIELLDPLDLRVPLERSFFRKWGVLEDRDPCVVEIRSRLARVLSGLSDEEGLLLLFVADCIAHAERAKNAWNPKANGARYTMLCKSAATWRVCPWLGTA